MQFSKETNKICRVTNEDSCPHCIYANTCPTPGLKRGAGRQGLDYYLLQSAFLFVVSPLQTSQITYFTSVQIVNVY